MGLLLIGMTAFAEDFKTIVKGAFGGVDRPLQVVVTNETQWVDLWTRHTASAIPKPSIPPIDFSKSSLIFVSSGRKTSGGYSIEISSVKQKNDYTEVTVTSKGPKPGALTAEALTAPFHIVEIPRVSGEVKFKIS